MSTAFHPQTDGQTERMNRTLEEMLRAYTTYHQNQWDECLSAAEFAYNNSKQSSTKMTPFELDNGQNPNTPMELSDAISTNVSAAEDTYTQWTTNINRAKDALLQAKERQEKYANQNRQHQEFEVGNQVMLSTAHIQDDINRRRPKKKLNPKFIGPYTIIEKLSSVVYKLDLPSSMKIHPVFHISLLKLYHQDDNMFHRDVPPPPEIIIDTNNQPSEEFEVERILDCKIVRGRKLYLIQWKGYPLHHAT
jgi:hypothetical protein